MDISFIKEYGNMNKTFRVTMQERQKDGSVRTITQVAVCPAEQDVIKFYGLNEPDIVSFDIKEVAGKA